MALSSHLESWKPGFQENVQGNENSYLKVSTWKCISVREMIVAGAPLMFILETLWQSQEMSKLKGNVFRALALGLLSNRILI